MDMVEFVVPDPESGDVRVTFRLDVSGRVSIYCTCPSGRSRQFCDHRFRILEGRVIGISESHAGDLLRARSWISNTEIEAELHALQAVRDSATAVVDRAKHRLALAMSA